LHLTDGEGVVHHLADAAAIEQALEFWDDYQESYICVDADARRVRLIVWNVELLVCQRVAPDYDREDLYLVAGQSVRLVEGTSRCTETRLCGRSSRKKRLAPWNRLDGKPERRATPAGRLSRVSWNLKWRSPA